MAGSGCTLTDEDRLGLADLMDKRAATLGLLARLYRVEVDEEFLESMKALRLSANTGNDDVDEGYRLMAKFLSGTYENTMTNLRVDYARTFIGHGVDAFSAAYPYESVYTSEKRLMMQDARDEVLALYRSQGLDKLASYKESEDHVALEIEFMQQLASRTADALRSKDESQAEALLIVQRNFLTDHLLNWVPLMTSDMRKFAKTDLYQGLAFLTDGILANDKELLDELLSDEEEQ